MCYLIFLCAEDFVFVALSCLFWQCRSDFIFARFGILFSKALYLFQFDYQFLNLHLLHFFFLVFATFLCIFK